MERDFNNDDFELFLKQKADQHKLFPSDKVWKGINNSLHPGMKWFKIGGSLLVVSSLIFIFQQTTFFGSSKTASRHTIVSASNASKQPADTKQTPSTKHISIAPVTPVETAPAIRESKKVASVTLNTTESSQQSNTSSTSDNNENIAYEFSDHQLQGFILHQDALLKQNISVSVSIPVTQEPVNTPAGNEEVVAEKDIKTTEVTVNSVASEEDLTVKDLNWLQEIAAIKLTPQKKSRFNLQFYFSPTISYRRLAENQNTTVSGSQAAPVSSRDLNVNRYVDHNPSIGAELGSNILFSAGRNLIFKSGLQLNYSRYNIKAFKFYTEKASIALNTAGPVADTISSYTSLRNFSGYFPEQLQNQYLQVSVPLGAELMLIGNKRLQFNVAGTIQPTFLLFSDTYLLSSNYLNYTKEPSLVRKWNVHSSFEAFLSYKIGGLRWQLGPQFRYQLMSSYNDRYPIKEYLFEYGLKIGISKTLR